MSTGRALRTLDRSRLLLTAGSVGGNETKSNKATTLLKSVYLLVVSVFLSACGLIDHFENRLENMNRSMDYSRNQLILLNIARARYDHPLTFFALTSVTGIQVVSGNVGIPSFPVGNLTSQANSTPAQKQFVFGPNSVNGSVSGNVGVTPLEAKEFYQGLLQPIGLNAAQFFVAQGYPRQILFFLFIESIRLRSSNSEKILWNDPTDPAFPAFVDYIRNWVELGVSIEPIPGHNGTNNLRLCFDRGLARASLAGLGPVCGRTAGSVVGLTGVVDPVLGRVSVTLVPRSTYGVFHYLGRLIDPEIGSQVLLTGDRAGGVIFGDDKRLFPVVRGDIPGRCLTSVTYMSETLCIPASGAEQGPLILQFLAQLIGLNVSVKDLPVLTNVRVTQ